MPFLGIFFVGWVALVGSLTATLVHHDNLFIQSEPDNAKILSASNIDVIEEKTTAFANAVKSSPVNSFVASSTIHERYIKEVGQINHVDVSAKNTTQVVSSSAKKIIAPIDNTIPLDNTSGNTVSLKIFIVGKGSVSLLQGSCSASCVKNIEKGKEITLTPYPQSGYQFSGWSGGECDGSDTCTITPSQSIEVAAIFTQVQDKPIILPDTITSTGYTLSQVATHSSQSDCWIIVSGKVYSVSSYINMHPGGKSVIINMCGKDATTAFTTKGGLGTHSSTAWSTLGGFLVGSLSDSIVLPQDPVKNQLATTTPIVQTPPTATTTSGSYTATQIATHSSQSDCWIVVNNNVYSVGAYIAMHPGGVTAIASMCGKDATTAFTTKNGLGTHSSAAWTLLGGYLVGVLSGQAPTQTPTPPTTTTSGSYTATQISTHSSQSDCWIVIGTNVYSVGAYLSLHPGGSYAISRYCGKNASTAFSTKGGINSSHSATANTMLGGFLVGTLSGAAPASTPVNPAPTTGYSLSQIATHSSQSDCWLAIGSYVYSVTNYISLHPGGRTRIINMCGKDATTSFNNVGHSNRAKTILGGLLVGNYLGNVSTPTNGACGSSNGSTVSSAPTSGLCSVGTASSVSGSGPWSWSCAGTNGGTTASCSASMTVSTTPTPTNGACGSSNGSTVSSAPTSGLCSVGTASSVSGAGPFAWTCAGTNGGSNASCSATLAAVASQTYSVTVDSAGNVNPASIQANSGDKIILNYTSSSGEAKVVISPSTVSSSRFTLDREINTKTVTINANDFYTVSVVQ